VIRSAPIDEHPVEDEIADHPEHRVGAQIGAVDHHGVPGIGQSGAVVAGIADRQCGEHQSGHRQQAEGDELTGVGPTVQTPHPPSVELERRDDADGDSHHVGDRR
jgi:hypothetical protein